MPGYSQAMQDEYGYDDYVEYGDYDGMFDLMDMPNDDETIEQLNLKYDPWITEGEGSR